MPLTPYGEWKPLDPYNNGKWDDSDGDASFDAKVSATSYTRSYDLLKYILSEPEQKYPSVTFEDDVDFTKGGRRIILRYP